MNKITLNETTIRVIRGYLSVLKDERVQIVEGIEAYEQRLEASRSELKTLDGKIQQLAESLTNGEP
jgi:hypothetical protein